MPRVRPAAVLGEERRHLAFGCARVATREARRQTRSLLSGPRCAMPHHGGRLTHLWRRMASEGACDSCNLGRARRRARARPGRTAIHAPVCARHAQLAGCAARSRARRAAGQDYEITTNNITYAHRSFSITGLSRNGAGSCRAARCQRQSGSQASDDGKMNTRMRETVPRLFFVHTDHDTSKY